MILVEACEILCPFLRPIWRENNEEKRREEKGLLGSSRKTQDIGDDAMLECIHHDSLRCFHV